MPLTPPPRAHQVRYHGVLAPGASQRDRVVPGEAALRPAEDSTDPGREGSPREAQTSPEATLLTGTPNGHPSRGEHSKHHPADSAGDPSHEELRFASGSRDRARCLRWASLLQRVFEIDALRCPRCGSTLRLIAAIEDPTVARKILECLALPARAPPLEPATAEPAELRHTEDGWLFDQSAVHDAP